MMYNHYTGTLYVGHIGSTDLSQDAQSIEDDCARLARALFCLKEKYYA